MKREIVGTWPPIRAYRRIVDVRGMTANDWGRVYLAYQAFLCQVRMIVAEVEARERTTRAVDDMNA